MMPFVGKNKQTGERIDITKLHNPLGELEKGSIVCPLCGKELSVRSQHVREHSKVRAHFFHPETCDSEFDAHPESIEHLEAKRLVCEWVADLYGASIPPTVEMEVPVKMDWRKRGRIIDVLATWATGNRHAFEIQLAAITLDEIKERTSDYERAGIVCTWILGSRLRYKGLEEHLLSRDGIVYFIDFSTADLSRTNLHGTGDRTETYAPSTYGGSRRNGHKRGAI